MTAVADRHLLFGLLGLQNAIIGQVQLVAAFQAWTLDRSRGLADHLEARGDLTPARRALLEALAEAHLDAHGGDLEKSLAAVSAGKSTQESLARIGGPDVEATLARVGSGSNGPGADHDRTMTMSVGTASVGTAPGDGRRFRVLRPYARGGLGAVFVALDGELNREVALKQILDRHADDPVSRQRFLVEAEITGGLEHPGIVPVYGLGTYDGGRPYYAMRFIRGDSLKEAIEQFHRPGRPGADPGDRSLELRKLLRRFTDVCNAIENAHSRGILHRDIKPGNVIVGRHGETLVVDWGLAKATGRGEPGALERTLRPSSASGSAETLPGSAMGTPAYMSPEQAAGDLDRLGPRSDVYSLGATLYCLLTGRPPFEGHDLGEVLRAVEQGRFPPPRAAEPAIDRALEAVCLKAMALRPEGRYGSPRALADDVERWAADEPVTAWREPFGRRVRRRARRHRTAVTAGAAAVLVALAGTAAVLAVQTRANGRLEASNRALLVANGQAQERFALAADAIKTFHTGVSEDFLLKEEKFKALRDRLLGSARDFYGLLGALLAGRSDRPSRQAMASSYHELGALTATVGSIEEALAVHRQALALRGALKDEAPDAAGARVDVADSLLAVGALLARTGRAAEAMAAYEDARALLESAPAPGASDPGVREGLGSCWGAIGLVQAETGGPEDALGSYARARAVFEGLVEAHPAVARYQAGLAQAHQQIGVVASRTGRLEDALASYEQAQRLREGLVKADPAAPKFREDLAAGYASLARLGVQTNRLDEARASYARAQAAFEGLVEAHPAVTRFRRNLAMVYHSTGFLLANTGRIDDARASYARARQIREALVKDNPSVPQYRSDLGATYGKIAAVRAGTGHPDEALALYGQARAIFEALVKADPAVSDYRDGLASCHSSTADLQRGRDRLDEARAGYDRAIALRVALVEAEPANAAYRSGLAAATRRLGLTRRAAGDDAGAAVDFRRAAAILEGLPSRSGEDWYELACCYAAGGGEADRAIRLLRRAADDGYRNPADIRTEVGLDPLRARPDFQLLMMDLSFPADPFATGR